MDVMSILNDSYILKFESVAIGSIIMFCVFFTYYFVRNLFFQASHSDFDVKEYNPVWLKIILFLLVVDCAMIYVIGTLKGVTL